MKPQLFFQILSAFITGVLFSLGLAISGMTQPQKVIGFLAWGPGWDPSLLFVMIGAISVHALSYRYIRGRSAPRLDSCWHIPNNQKITKPLLLGSVLFGIGWGLVGYCPGPALASLVGGGMSAVLFVIAMLIGMFLYRWSPLRAK